MHCCEFSWGGQKLPGNAINFCFRFYSGVKTLWIGTFSFCRACVMSVHGESLNFDFLANLRYVNTTIAVLYFYLKYQETSRVNIFQTPLPSHHSHQRENTRFGLSGAMQIGCKSWNQSHQLGPCGSKAGKDLSSLGLKLRSALSRWISCCPPSDF